MTSQSSHDSGGNVVSHASWLPLARPTNRIWMLEFNLSKIYILASQRNGTLYVGSTLDIIKRTWEHKNKIIPGFTAKYNVHMLVYYEVHELYVEAARREKRFKNWPRQWKINLIERLGSVDNSLD